jgi:hypothetical protein
VPLALYSEVGKSKRKGNENVSGFKKNKFGWIEKRGQKARLGYQIWQRRNNVGQKRL